MKFALFFAFATRGILICDEALFSFSIVFWSEMWVLNCSRGFRYWVCVFMLVSCHDSIYIDSSVKMC